MIIEKRLVLLLVLVVLLNLSGINAMLGLSPARIELDYEPGGKFFSHFSVIGDPDQELEVYASGNFNDSVTFDKNETSGGDTFVVYLDLPLTTEHYGLNPLFIRVREKLEPGRGVGTRMEVGALILIKVPYPGQYAEINSFRVFDTNEGEPVDFNLVIENLGQENIYTMCKADVSTDGNFINSIDLGTEFMYPRNVTKFEYEVEGGYYKPGIYNATAYADYGAGKLNETVVFRVGTLFVDIVKWREDFNKSKINEFYVEVESKWNNDIDNVHAEINVTNSTGAQVDFFKTPSIKLKRWEIANLTGFFNAEKLVNGEYDANITIFYEKMTTSKLGKFNIFGKDSLLKSLMANKLVLGVLIGIGIIFIIFISVAISYVLLKKQLMKNEKRSKKKK